jgi:diaminopimelate decarboxylase
MALDCGMLAEGISAAEVRSALRTGFAPERIVLNGPAKSWSGNGITGADLPALKVTFSDSWEELRELARDPRQRSVGIRLRPPGLRSRFGVAYDLPDTYERMLRAVRSAPAGRPLAIHFHMASNVVGVLDWWTLFESAVESAAEIARSTRRPVVTLDVGGGWFPDDWFSEFTPALAKRLKGARTVLPELGEVILEPGKALTQPVHALVVRVLQIRANRGSGPGGREVVVDGAISDLPEAHSYPHRVLVEDPSRGWRPVNRGSDRLLGRICMEHDVLARDLRLPTDIAEGDTLVLADAGAYDRSMSYAFGRGS